MGGSCSSDSKKSSNPRNLEKDLKKYCVEMKVFIEKEIITKNVEKEKYDIELMKLIKLFPRSLDQEKAAATKIVYLNETRETYDHINFICDSIVQQSHLIALYYKELDKMNSFNSSFQYLFWIQKKISCEKLNEFVNYINKANWYRNELKNIYNNDDLIPNKTKKLFEQYLPDQGLVDQFLDFYYAKNNVQNIQKH